ncbi:GGDEF domain-containing protein [Candidatus Phyllobacterium onerii]|uniref:GGDEF domain-containing protein n=1 Tax=Candidatus Phyllobacterium onerii TaxID=3020828 RepID=UPI003A8597D6
MDIQEKPDSAALTRVDIQNDPLIMAEVERLLGGRTRDIRLKGKISRVFRDRIWSQTAKIIRAWMIWVALLDVLTLALNLLMLPRDVALSMLLPGSFLPPVALGVAFVWRKPRAHWLQAAVLIVGIFLILLSIALVGRSAGGEFHERHLNIMLFVAITAIIIFAIPLSSTIAIAGFALGLYLAFQLQNPNLEIASSLDATLFFAIGIIATIVARRTMTILAQKTFLLELRDKRRVNQLADANARLEHLARTDPLTGIANRRWMMETLDQLWSRSRKYSGQVAMLMCDIDDFKNLNDRLGHAEGDRCLIKVAGIIQSHMRRERDHVARYGGEEFLVVLPEMEEREASALAERIRESIEAAALSNPSSSISNCVTLSIGVAVQALGDSISPEQLQRRADMALYRAKQTGRNRVELHRPGD